MQLPVANLTGHEDADDLNKSKEDTLERNGVLPFPTSHR